jgi:hypothetical protein
MRLAWAGQPRQSLNSTHFAAPSALPGLLKRRLASTDRGGHSRWKAARRATLHESGEARRRVAGGVVIGSVGEGGVAELHPTPAPLHAARGHGGTHSTARRPRAMPTSTQGSLTMATSNRRRISTGLTDVTKRRKVVLGSPEYGKCRLISPANGYLSAGQVYVTVPRRPDDPAGKGEDQTPDHRAPALATPQFRCLE